MSQHIAVPDRARRNVRTIVNVVLSVAVVILGLVPVILQALEPLQEHLPGGWYLWLVGVAGTVVAVATAVQKILTSDAVERLLQARAPGLAASPLVDGVAQITTLTSEDRTELGLVATALPPGSPGRTAIENVLRS